MKKFRTAVFLTIVSFALVSAAFAQAPGKNKKFEFSTSASMVNVKGDSDETETMINIPVRLGFFIFKGFEIEPEFYLSIPEESDYTGYFINLNVAYNFRAGERIYPFILAGGGYGNGAHMWGIVFDLDMGITALNLGAGVKIMVGNSAAVRLEYRFSGLKGEAKRTYGWGDYSYSYTDKTDLTYHNVLVGISLFF